MVFEQDSELITESEVYKGTKVLMINSTKTGGGVAWLMKDLLPLMTSLGLRVDWEVIKAPESFFETTKSFHNILQGEDNKNVDEFIEDYENFYKQDFKEMNKPLLDKISQNNYDFIIVHDPQPLKLIDYKSLSPDSKWIWRCHIDISKSNHTLWDYVSLSLPKFDKIVVSSELYKKQDDYFIIPPSISPNSDINKEMTTDEANNLIRLNEIPLDKPLITQISRFDKWKDPVGVLKVFEVVKDMGIDCRLVMKAEFADDDPEGEMIKDMFDVAALKSKYKEDIIVNTSRDKKLVNALQRRSSVILQKSIKEGFALTVSESLWKGTPVIGTKVGGIPLQIIDNENGFLVDIKDYDAHIQDAANRVKFLIENPDIAKIMGERGKLHVSKNFLTKHHVLNYFKLFSSLGFAAKEKAIPQTNIPNY